jgi:DNA-binding transcriptional MerR regulator
MDPTKAPDAFRTISEVAEDLDLPQHVLRFWETRFTQIKPMKRGGGRRYYRPDDVDLLRGIRTLLYSDGFTIRGVQRVFKERGVGYVAGIGEGVRGGPDLGKAPPPLERRHDMAGVEPRASGSDEVHAGALGGPAVASDGRPGGHFGAPGPSKTGIGAAALDERARRRLQAVIADLLEARRVLDQTR